MKKNVIFITGYPFSDVVIQNRMTPLFSAFRDRGWIIELVTFLTKDQLKMFKNKVSFIVCIS